MSWKNESNMRAAMAAAVKAPGLTKPTLRRFTWSRLHTDLLDDMRWPLVAKRANAPLPLVEAVLIRLENHANRSNPRGYVGDFNPEGLAVRWGVDTDMIGRIFAQLEAPDIGWIDQEQLVTFWDRNPDAVDNSAADRQQRTRDRKKAMKQLAAWAAMGTISQQQRLDREIAIKDSRDPRALMMAWATALSTAAQNVTRDAVTVTTRADHFTKEEAARKEKEGSFSSKIPNESGDFVDSHAAETWLCTEGVTAVTERLQTTRMLAETIIARWKRELDDNPVVIANIMRQAAAVTRLKNFQNLVTDQIARQLADRNGPQLPLPPVVATNRSSNG